MKRNTIIGLVILIIILVGVFLIFEGRPSPFSLRFFDRDEKELIAFEKDIALFEQDSVIMDELNQTFSDILDESTVADIESALDLASLDKESSDADFSDDLNVFDEDILGELNQILGEVSR